MNVDDDVPHSVIHVFEALVTENPGIRDQYVELAKIINTRFDHVSSVFGYRNITVIGNCFAARVLNFLHHGVSHVRARTAAVSSAAQIVNDDRCALTRKKKCVSPTETSACTGYQRNLSIQHTHVVLR